MRVLFASAEIFPYTKTGGLADVAHALPLALQHEMHISRVMPLYGFMDETAYRFFTSFTVTLAYQVYHVEVYSTEERGVKNYFIKAPHLSETSHPYGDSRGDYRDNALRFGIFCMAIVALALRLNSSLIHLNDWHTALVALYVKQNALKIKTLYTIHNLAYQGIFEKENLALLGIGWEYFTMDTLEFYGKLNLMKAGIAFSDTVTTVSPTYAQEILTPAYGCGLDGFLRLHQQKLYGILNGIDEVMFPPLKSRHQKREAKALLSQRFGLPVSKRPLFVMVSRLVAQKGLPLLRECFEALLQEEITLFIIGEGEVAYRTFFKAQAKRYAHFAFFKGYDEALSLQSYQASDFLLMPSVFEPCGLNQLIAMSQGSIPVVHRVGGLKDSVHETEAVCGQGISYETQTPQAFLFAIKRALLLYREKEKLEEKIAFNLACDFSFKKSAKAYVHLYKELV